MTYSENADKSNSSFLKKSIFKRQGYKSFGEKVI